MVIVPSPLQASQRPPLTLKLKRPGEYPRARASWVLEKSWRMWSKRPV